MQETIASATDERPSETIVELIADLEGTRPTELAPLLYSAVDPEALDSLFHASNSDGSRTRRSLNFHYRGYEIVVESDGDVAITNVDDGR